MTNATSAPSDGLSAPGLRSALLAACVAQFLLPFMVGGLTPLLPALGKDLNASAMHLGLVGAVYALSLAVFHLLAGRIGDIIGRRRLFLTGIGLFVAMSTALPFSPSITVFLALRFMQAVGTACMNTSVLAILVACAPPAIRGRVLGISSIGIFAGISCGPPIGGFIATQLSWHWLFWMMLPLGLVALCLVAFNIRNEWVHAADAPFDWVGAFCWLFAMSGLACGATWILAGPWAWGLLAFGALSLGVFLLAEQRTAKKGRCPVLDMEIVFHNRPFLLNSAISFICNCTILGEVFLLGLYAQFGQGLTMQQAGFMLSIQPVIQLVLAPVAGRLADRCGAAKVAAGGVFVCGMGMLAASFLDMGSPVIHTAACLVVVGSGLAFFGAPNTSAVFGSVDEAHLSQASGVVGTVRTMGMLASMVIVSLSMNAFLGSEAAGPHNARQFLAAMHTDFTVFSLLAATALLLSALLLWRYPAKPNASR